MRGKECTSRRVLLIAVGRPEQDPVPLQIGERLGHISGVDHHEAALRRGAVAARERRNRYDVEAEPAGVGLHDRSLADHEVEAAVGEGIERLAESHRDLAAERLAEKRGQLLIVALGMALHARTRELLRQRVHDREPERLGGGRSPGHEGGSQEDHGGEPAARDHDFFSNTRTRPRLMSR